MVLVEYSDSSSDSDDLESPDKKLIHDQNPSRHQHISTKDEQRNQAQKRKADEDQITQTRTRPPPLPSSLRSLYATNTRTSTSDDPALHGGRRRQIAHVEGNWPSHVYLEWVPTRSQHALLNDIISKTQAILSNCSSIAALDDESSRFKLNTFLQTDLQVSLPLHISLSAPIVLHTTTKDKFRASLADAVAQSRVRAVDISATDLDIVPNFEASRWFLVLRVGVVAGESDGGDPLTQLLNVCNRVCRDFGLTTLYETGSGIGIDHENAKYNDKMAANGHIDGQGQGRGRHSSPFHVSVAWMLGPAGSVESREGQDAIMAAVRKAVREIKLTDIGTEKIRFGQIKVKTGNVVDVVPL